MSTSSHREIETDAPPLSRGLEALLKGSHWLRNTMGQAGAEVYRVRQKDGREHYLKCSRGDEEVATALADEAARMRWLRRHAAALRPLLPTVQHFEQTGEGQAWLLSTAMAVARPVNGLKSSPARSSREPWCDRWRDN